MSEAVEWHSRIAVDFDARYTTSAPFRERLAVWTAMIGAIVTPGSRVLDAGCGSGVIGDVAAGLGAEVFAIDGSAEMVALARDRAARNGRTRSTCAVARIGDPQLIADRAFDVILCSSVLEYLDDWWLAFDWLAASLAPGGTVIFSIPNAASLYRQFERLAFRLTGRPAYYAHVRHLVHLRDVDTGLALRGMTRGKFAYYAATPGLGDVARAAGHPEWGSALFVVTCCRAR